MPNRLQPLVEQWYQDLDTGQPFYITALDAHSGNVEVQRYDGELGEYTLPEWHSLNIEFCDPPENWTGPMDSGDDTGTDTGEPGERDWQAQRELLPEPALEQDAAPDAAAEGASETAAPEQFEALLPAGQRPRGRAGPGP